MRSFRLEGQNDHCGLTNAHGDSTAGAPHGCTLLRRAAKFLSAACRSPCSLQVDALNSKAGNCGAVMRYLRVPRTAGLHSLTQPRPKLAMLGKPGCYLSYPHLRKCSTIAQPESGLWLKNWAQSGWLSVASCHKIGALPHAR